MGEYVANQLTCALCLPGGDVAGTILLANDLPTPRIKHCVPPAPGMPEVRQPKPSCSATTIVPVLLLPQSA